MRRKPNESRLWIDFLFALWHFLFLTDANPEGCGLTSYSLFDILWGLLSPMTEVVDWLLIRSLTLFTDVLPIWKWLWIDFLFALWHLIGQVLPPTKVVDWLLIRSLTLCLQVQRQEMSCGLTSYSLFDIWRPRNVRCNLVVDWLLIRSLTLVHVIGSSNTQLWIDFLFALWHFSLKLSYKFIVVDWLLIRSLTLQQKV